MEESQSQIPTVIREVYDNENSSDMFEQQLEKALETFCEIIVIEPHHLGDETARWIKVGNCLHTTAVLSGVSSVTVTFLANNENCFVFIPFTALSAFCTGLYMICWQFDPCCKYQVTRNTSVLDDHETLLLSLTSTSPTILVKKDDTTRKIIHTTITLVAILFSTFRFYRCCCVK